jgi:hypothetical protein
MFPLIRLAIQAFLKPHTLNDKASCKKFLQDLLAFVKPLAAQTKTEIDDVILQILEYIVKTDTLFDYFYKLFTDQLSTNEIIFEDVDEDELFALLKQAPEPLPEAINPLLIASLVSQAISLINALKQIRAR